MKQTWLFCKKSSSWASACILVSLLFLVAGGVVAGDEPGDAMQFDITVLPGIERHLDLLPYPPYLAVALENNGIRPSNSGRPIITDDHSLRFKGATLRFVERKGRKFSYEAGIEWDIAAKQITFKVPVEVDTTSLASGKLSLRFYIPLARFFPQTINERIKLKVQNLGAEPVQQKMLDYFDGLKKKEMPHGGTVGVLKQILVQGYNHPSGIVSHSVVCEPGDAEPLSDQVLLLATLVIWLVIVPLGIYLWRFFKHKRIGG